MNLKKRKAFAMIVLAVSLFVNLSIGTVFHISAADQQTGVVTANDLRVRSGAGTSYDVLGYINTGDCVVILDSQMIGSVKWYKITCLIAGNQVTGWSSGDHIQLLEPDPEFETYLTAQGFPEDYKPNLRAMHALYPDWVFQAVHTQLEWSDVVAGETVLGRNLVHKSSPAAYINTSDVDSSGNQIGRDGSSWVAASDGIVTYYLDPRNFLYMPRVFMFESLSYDKENHTIEGVENILKGTFMSKENTFVADGKTYTYAQAFMEAAEVSGVSPYHLASRCKQEQGVNGSVLSDGTVSGYTGYYNFFNYGAYASGGRSAAVNGAIYASNVSATYFGPWTNPLYSIKGGAKLLGQSYINIGQDTIYFQKFNVVYKPSLYTHQYMTNVQAPYSESSIMRNAYDEESIQFSLVFRIPVYLNMPNSPVSLPTTSSPVTPTVSSNNYVIASGRISAVNVGASVSEFLGKVSVTNGTARVVTAGGSVKTGGTMVTGDKLQILNSSGSLVSASYNVVIWGDVNGDGKIALADLLLIQKHLLGASSLSGAYLTAADVSGDGNMTIADLLVVQRHLLDVSKITQTR